MAKRDAWRHSVGKKDHHVSVFEHPARKLVLYMSWPDPANPAKPKHESLGRTLRTADGRIIKDVERWAKARAQEKYEQLVAGKANAAESRGLPRVALTLVEGLKRATDSRTGKYATDSKHRRNVVKEVEFAIAIWTAAPIANSDEPWGRGRTWNSITRADLRMLGRARVDALLDVKAAEEKEGSRSRVTGFRQAEFCVQAANAVARWLRDEGLIDESAAIAPANWKEELQNYWIAKSGAHEAHKPSQPRYSIEEMRSILKQTAQVDVRLNLLAELGVEQRLGQVHKCMRSQLTLPRALDPRVQRDVEFAELVIPSRGKKRTPVLELTPGQLETVKRALGEDGYLSELEAAYQVREIDDYPLFPAGQMPGGRAHLSDGTRKRDARTPSHPTATVERHANAKPVGMRAVQDWWREAEALAGVEHIDGRGPYGGRRRGVEEAKRLKISREGLMAHGGWSDTQTPDNVYADQENKVGRAEARMVRAKIRGEE